MRSLREEIVELQQPAAHIGEVVKPIGKDKIMVKINQDGKYIVDLDKGVKVEDCKANTRVALKANSY